MAIAYIYNITYKFTGRVKMNSTIFYFTGTGNSLYIAKQLAERLEMPIHSTYTRTHGYSQLSGVEGQVKGAWGYSKRS